MEQQQDERSRHIVRHPRTYTGLTCLAPFCARNKDDINGAAEMLDFLLEFIRKGLKLQLIWYLMINPLPVVV